MRRLYIHAPYTHVGLSSPHISNAVLRSALSEAPTRMAGFKADFDVLHTVLEAICFRCLEISDLLVNATYELQVRRLDLLTEKCT
jgi:hypothetical protein